jgi:hypothetical protein
MAAQAGVAAAAIPSKASRPVRTQRRAFIPPKSAFYWHAPALQTPESHTTPHAPQLFGSVPITFVQVPLHSMVPVGHEATHVLFTSHDRTAPLGGEVGHIAHIPPQNSVPGPHAWQLPPEQMSLVGHTMPHAPQLFGSVPITFVQTPLQFRVPEGHEATHVLFTPHDRTAPLGGEVGHIAHVPPQNSVPGPHAWQVPPEQMSLVGHTMPHAPQLFGSVPITFVQTPLQFMVPEGHEATHVLFMPHDRTAPLGGEVGHVAHVPPQNSVPGPQAWQVPPEHTSLAGHVLPHAPQLFGSLEKFTHVLVAEQKLGKSVLLAHEPTHVDPLHARLPPLGAAGHAAQTPGDGPQSSVLEGQDWQLPFEQPDPPGHTLVGVPHPPQWAGSVAKLTHAFPHWLGNVEAVLHSATHMLPLHAVMPFVGAGGHIAQTPGDVDVAAQSSVLPGHG